MLEMLTPKMHLFLHTDCLNVRVHLCVRKKKALAKGAGLLPHHHRDPSLGNPACSRRHPTYSFQQPSHSSRGTSPFLSEKTK